MNTHPVHEPTPQERAARCGVFDTVESARRAVDKLLAAGFSTPEITVICSDDNKEATFREFEHQDPAGTYAPAAATTGAVIGATLGGLAAVASTVATGGVALLAAGGLAAWTGGVLGGFVGAMMTRGVEGELANFYNQSVEAGKLLVAVDVHGDDAPHRLRDAEAILTAAGAVAAPLSEG